MSFKKIFIFSVFTFLIALLWMTTAQSATLNVQNTLIKMNAAYGDYSNLSLLYEKYQQSTQNFLVTVNAVDKITGNYEYKHIVKTNPKRKRDIVLAQLESPVTAFKIKNGMVYRSAGGFDYPMDSLAHFVTERFYPGFEEIFIESLENISAMGTVTENFYLVYADLPVTAGSTLNIVIQVDKNTHLINKIEYYVDEGRQFLFKSIYLNYINHSGEYFLERIGTIYSQAAFIDVERFYSPDYVRIPKKDFNLNNPPPSPPATPPSSQIDPWLPGQTAKFEKGSALTPFQSYGSAGEEVPGHSGALQLSYTDLEIPGRAGMNVSVKRSYLSQQFTANPKPTSFSENPFRVDYPLGTYSSTWDMSGSNTFLSNYKLVQPDGWAGWMGKGWQTSIGGELYINEIHSFSVAGPLYPNLAMSRFNSASQYSYSFQTADGIRVDFEQEFKAEHNQFVDANTLNSIGNNVTNMIEYRKNMENTGAIAKPSRFLVAKDKRIKMKIEIVDDLHYILYTPSGQKYHFEKKVFNKIANWSRDLNNGTILSRGRAFMTFQFVSKIFYLTKVEDVHGNVITYQYEKTFDAITKNGSGKSYDTGIRTNMLTALNIVPILLLAPPPGSDGGTTEVFLHEIMLKIANQVDMAKGLGETAMEPGANFDSFMQTQAPYFAMSYAMEPILKLVVQLVGLVPYPYRPLAVLAAYTLCYADSSEVNMKYYVEYTVEGWRPNRIVDTLGRNIDLTYRGAYDPNSIRDSQLAEIKYQGPNGENNVIKYTYNNNDMLVRVDYPAGNPVEYEYQFFDQGLTDEKIMDDGYLLTKVHHPSGFESQYGYRWYEPKADTTAFTDQINVDENKSYSYYIVTQKTHDAVGQIPRTWKYEYTRGSTYYQYVDEPTGVSKRWQFKSHRITDPQGLVTEQDFVIGQLERLRTPQIAQGTPYVTEHLILNLYDMKTGLLVSQNILKGPNAHVTNYEYDEYSQPIKIIDYGMYNNDKDTRVTRIVYDLNEELITKNIYGKVKEQWIEEGPTDPDKTYAVSFNAGVKYARVQNTYSALGDLIQVKKYKNDSEYVENRFEYDVYGNVVKQWDELNSLTEMMYQSGAYPIQTTKYVGGKPITTRSTVSAYTGVPLSQTNEIGYTVAYDYDVLGRKTKETHPDGSFEKIDYLDTLNQTHVIDRKGRKTQYVYTGFGELSTITDPLNQTTKFETNTLGKLWKITLTDGRQYEYTYDEIYRPIKVTYPDGTFAKKAYEDAQNKILVWDENGHGMEYAYDAFGNLERVIRGDTQDKTIYSYDFANQITKITSPLGYKTSFQNNLLGQRLNKTQPNGDQEQFIYDAAGNLIKHINYENKNILYSYDELGRVLTQTYADPKENISYEYDQGLNALGKLSKVMDPSGTTEFTYNQLGLITTEKKTLGPDVFTTQYDYDNTGLLQSITYPAVYGQNVKVFYQYDALDRLSNVALAKNNAAPQNLTSYVYNNAGLLTNRKYASGLEEIMTYDLKDRLTSHTLMDSTKQIFKYTYTYDNAGNVIQRDIQDLNYISRRDNYQYDYINQLVKVDIPGARDLEFAYDKQYNRQFMNHGFGVVSYNYDLAMNYLNYYDETVSVAGPMFNGVTNTANPLGALRVEFNYSKQGNPLSRKYKDKDLNQVLAQENLLWNDKDELVAITGRVTANYIYDYRGFRVLKNNTRYLYLQNNQPSLKINQNSTDLFVYAGRDRVMRIRIDAMGQTKSEYFINDYLGSPVVVADAVTNTVNYQQYQDPFGNLESSIGVPSSNPEFRYTDKEYEEDQDLFYFAARYYDPVAGRFWGRDPVKIEEKENNLFHMNPYIYANNNPVINIDPDGREVFYDNKNQTVNPELTNLLNRLDTKVFVDWDIRVYSGKRSAEQNQNAKGGKDSLHLLGDAADIQIVKRDKNGKIIESMNYTTAAIGSYKAGVPRIITYSGRQENGTIHIDLGTSKLTTPGDMLRAIPQKDGSYKYEKNRDSKYWEPIIEKYREIRVNTINKLKEK